MLERTSFEYLVTMTNTQNEMVARQLEFAAYVREKIDAILGQEYLGNPISYVSPIEVADIAEHWQPFFRLFDKLMMLHFEDDAEGFEPRAIMPFGLIDGTMAAGPYIGAREIYDCAYLPSMRTNNGSFGEYLQFLGFPLDKLCNST